MNIFSFSCTHHSVGCSCTGYKLSVINLHSVGCTHSSVAVSCKYSVTVNISTDVMKVYNRQFVVRVGTTDRVMRTTDREYVYTTVSL